MATFKEYNATGGASEPFAIPSFTSDEIKVRIDGVLKTAGTHYNITSYTVNGGTVSWINNSGSGGTNHTPSSGTVRIYRETDIINNANTDIEPYATYYAGSSIKADDLNGNQRQVLRALAEGRELKQTWQLGSNEVQTTNIANDAITGDKIADDQINSEHYADGSIDTAHIADNQITTGKISDLQITTGKIADGAVTAAKIATGTLTTNQIGSSAVTTSNIAANSVDSSKIIDNTIVNADINTSAAIVGSKLADDSIAKEKLSDTILKGLATSLTSSASELNQLDGKTITTSLSSNNTTIPTGAAVNSHVVNLLDALGGFVAIANEVSFPNSNPDPEDDAGTAVSIGDAGGVSVDSNGTSTTGRTLGGATVTITGFPNAMKGVVGGANKVLAAGMGLIVQTTSTLNTYTYHKAIGTDSDIITISDQVSSFNQRYRFGSTDPTSDNDQGDLFFNTSTNIFKVYDDGAWIKTVPSDADLSNIGIVAGELGWSDDLGSITDSLTTASGGDINTVASNITSVNRYADEYKIAGSAPGSPSAGDLWYDTGNNVIKVYTGSTWKEAFSASDILDEDNFASNSATKVPSQQSVKAYVDGQTENDTTYAISCVDGDNTDEEKIRLTAGGSGSGTDDVVLEAGTGLSIARSGDKITFTNTVSDTNTQLSNAEVRTAVEAASDSNVFTDADHSKLNAIEASATADQTGAEIKSAYEGESDTNAYTDAEKTKLAGIEASATADQTNAEIRAAVEAASDSNVFTDADHSKLNAIAASANNYVHPNHSGEVTSTADGATVIASNIIDEDNLKVDNSPTNDYVLTAKSSAAGGLTWAQVTGGSDTTYTHTWVDSSNDAILRLTAGGSGSGNDDLTIVAGSNVTLTPSGDNLTIAATDTNTTYSVGDGGLTQNNFTNTLKTKLDGIEASATADQSNAEIRAAVEAASDSNVFTDADHTKLNGIAASANNYAISSDLLDEDNMSSNSATKVPSQQSVKAYVDTEVAGVVDSAPGALNTLNELAAALGDDANFSTTVTNSIAAKLPLGGGTMTGNIVMSGSETVDGRDLSVDGAKLDGIEASATADQTAAEIRTLVESASDSNVFTDADHSKLNAIEASATADQSAAEIIALIAGETIAPNVITTTNLTLDFGTL